jgi:endonuclease/exonuclease/phosphatase family metal-dependent hydrolase
MQRQRIRLLSFNVQAGASTTRYRDYLTGAHQHVFASKNKATHLQAIADLAKQFDIVALQEIDVGSLRSGFVDQAVTIADLANHDFRYAQTNRVVGTIGRNQTISLAKSGNVVLSKIAAQSQHELRLPGRGRGALHVRFEHFDLYNLHLSLTQRLQHLQLEFLADHIDQSRANLIVGDFNCTPDSHAVREFCTSLSLRAVHTPYSFPSWAPNRAIDLALVSAHFHHIEVLPQTRLASDHVPIALSFDI